jgi:hypothetical protein
MEKILFYTALFCFSYLNGYSQIIIKGKVFDSDKKTISGANIFLKDSYDGATSDSTGNFSFKSSKTGNQTLVVSFIGYDLFEQIVDLENKEIEISITLKSANVEISTVTITAGSFEASDTKKSTTFKPLDIVTTAFGGSDIYGALNTLPGTSKVGEKGELFVRGGEGYETKTFIDGSMIQKPYNSTMPDLPSRGRFSPFLFTGTLFSTGGYSAEYGQALSSALILNTEGLAPESVTSLSLMSVGLGIGRTQRWKNTSISVSADYTNLTPYMNLIKQETDWKKMPVGAGGLLTFRQKTKNNGMLKIMTSYDNDFSKLAYPDFNIDNQKLEIRLSQKHIYWNANYNVPLSKSVNLFTAISYSDDYDKTDIDSSSVKNNTKNITGKYTLNYRFSDKIAIKFGNELNYKTYNQNYFDAVLNTDYLPKFEDYTSSIFAESDITITKKIAGRIGVRCEFSSLLSRFNLVPRLSFAYKLNESSQFSAGYGWFYETPQDDYLKFNHSLNFEKATHYIANYQYICGNRTFRIEGYYKKYENLVKYDSLNQYSAESYSNNGNGYSRGVDIFWRDKPNSGIFDYWISYSFLDTKRNYKDFPIAAVPNFVSKHNVSVVAKYWINSLNVYLSTAYTFASGRTYENPNNPNFLSDKTKDFNDLSASISYLTKILGNFAIVYFSVSNIPGFKNVYGYHFANQPDNEGIYESQPITSPAIRFIFLGIFISVK